MTLPEIAQLEFKPVEEAVVADLGKTFKYDFVKGDFVLKDGKLVEATDLEGIMVWVEKILRTEKYKFKVYQRQDRQEYGISIQDLIGSVLPKSFVESELRREITDAVLKHPRIASISNLAIERDGARALISFKLNLTDGQAGLQEVAF